MTTATTMTCIFLTFAVFGRRAWFADEARRARLARVARVSFVCGLLALAAYVLLPNGLYRLLVSGWDSEFGIATYDFLFAALYLLAFALFTHAFLLLALLEYVPASGQAPAAAPT